MSWKHDTYGNPKVIGSDGETIGEWDQTNGVLHTESGEDLHVDSDGYVYTSDSCIGQIGSDGRLS